MAMATDRDFEVIIIGAGAAGLSAALFTTREKLKTLLIERSTFGGQIANAETIENYPGLPEHIRGIDLAVNMLDQTKLYGLQMAFAEVEALHVDQRPFVVDTSMGTYTSHVVILACGSSLKRLGLGGEVEFEGRGVSYCATCDGAMFHQQPVAGVFIYVGLQPNTDFLQGVVPLDGGGHVPVNHRMETEIPGLFAAGDLRQYAARQVISSAGDGATAAVFALQYLRSQQ
jgi:thioredoxin reductase